MKYSMAEIESVTAETDLKGWKIKLSEGEQVTCAEKFFESHLAMCKANAQSKISIPYFNRLQIAFRALIDGECFKPKSL